MNVPTGQYCPPSIGMVAAFNWNPWPGSSESATLVRAADWCGQDLRDCDAAGKRLALPIVFVFGHLAPLLRNFEELFLDKGIARLFGEFFALSCLGAILFCLGRHSPSPRSAGR